MSPWFDCLCWWRLEKNNGPVFLPAESDQSDQSGEVRDETHTYPEALSSELFVSDEDYFAFLNDSIVA